MDIYIYMLNCLQYRGDGAPRLIKQRVDVPGLIDSKRRRGFNSMALTQTWLPLISRLVYIHGLNKPAATPNTEHAR